MLREYINRKIRENEECTIELEGDIKKLQDQKKELEKHIKIIEDENNDGSEIFSPRNHREQNLDKLKHYREDMERVSQETEEKLCKLSEAKKKKSEYESMLKEAERNYQEEKERYSDISLQTEDQNQGVKTEKDQDEEREQKRQPEDEQTDADAGRQADEDSQAEDQSQSLQEEGNQADEGENQTDRRQIEYLEGESESIKEQESPQDGKLVSGEEKDSLTEIQNKEEQEIQPAYEGQESHPTDMDTKRIIQKSIEEIVKRIEVEKNPHSGQTKNSQEKYDTGQSRNRNFLERADKNNNLDEIEIKSGELIVLESERKKEKEFLEKVKKSIDLSYIYSGNRNKCRGELIKVKKMIEDYIASIE